MSGGMVGYNLESRHPGMIHSTLIEIGFKEDFAKIIQPTQSDGKRGWSVAK